VCACMLSRRLERVCIALLCLCISSTDVLVSSSSSSIRTSATIASTRPTTATAQQQEQQQAHEGSLSSFSYESHTSQAHRSTIANGSDKECAKIRQYYRDAHSTKALFAKPTLNNEEELAFLHIPKNAGSSVFRVFGRLRIRDTNFTNSEYSDCNNRHVPPQYWKPSNPFVGKKVFCIIRDPVDKAISEFKMRQAGSLNESDIIQRLEGWLMSRQGWGRGGIDCHMVPQHSYVWNANGKWVVYCTCLCCCSSVVI
jgi:hypothetical protein